MGKKKHKREWWSDLGKAMAQDQCRGNRTGKDEDEGKAHERETFYTRETE